MGYQKYAAKSMEVSFMANLQNTGNALSGLTAEQAKKLQETFGKNELPPRKKESFFHKILEVLSEPMFLLLIVAAIIYFVLGEPSHQGKRSVCG
jgi:magnesium-transporting ATPase (P-type)